MMKFVSNKYLVLIFRIFIASVFIFSGIEKITSPEKFADAILNYKLFPIFSINLIAIIIPWLELFIGVLLLFGIWIKENSMISFILLILFTVLVATTMLRGLDISCGCFGTKFAQKVGLLKIGENTILMVISYIVFQFESRIKKNEN